MNDKEETEVAVAEDTTQEPVSPPQAAKSETPPEPSSQRSLSPTEELDPLTVEESDPQLEERIAESLHRAASSPAQGASEQQSREPRDRERSYSEWSEEAPDARDAPSLPREDFQVPSQDLPVRLRSEVPDIRVLGRDDAEKKVQVFVPPGSFTSAVAASGVGASPRIVLVHGPKEFGKFACAVQWALSQCRAAWRENGLYTYWRSKTESSPLTAVVEREEWPRGGVVILADAFERGDLVAELESTRLEQLSDLLESSRSYLLLTGVLSATHLRKVACLKIDAEGVDLKSVLRNHLRFYVGTHAGPLSSDVQQRVEAEIDQLIGLLKKPHLVDEFCKLLICDYHGAADVVAVALEIAASDPERLRVLFDDLPTSQKLFGLLAFLFEGVEYSAFREIYRQATEALRESGFPWARDARAVGFLDFAERLQLQPSGRSVQLPDEPTRCELRRQCTNRQLLLWSALGPAATAIAQTGAWVADCPARFLAAAIGRLGRDDPRRLGEFLRLWAMAATKKPWGHRVASLPGSSMAQLLDGEPFVGWAEIRPILVDWVRSTERELLWAAGAAIWRIFWKACELPPDQEKAGREIRSELLDIVGLLVQRPIGGDMLFRLVLNARLEAPEADPRELGKKVRGEHWRLRRELTGCVAFALTKMGTVDREAISRLLRDWLAKPKGTILWGTALDATERSFLSLAWDADAENLPANQPVLCLIGPVLVAVGPEKAVSETMFVALRAWLKWPSWHNAIFSELLSIANLGDSKTRVSLRAALARFWLASDDDLARSMAQAVICRCQVMDGVVVDHPDYGTTVLAVDPAFFSEDLPVDILSQNRESVLSKRRGAAWHLAGLLEAQLDLTAVRLGHRGAQPLEEKLEGFDLESPSENHRLLLPGLEAVEREGPRLLVVLTTGEVPDLDDALDGSWTRNVLVIGAGRDVPGGEGVDVLRVGRNFETTDLHKVEGWLETRWAYALAVATPEAWWLALRSFGYERVDPVTLEQRLVTEVGRLQEIGTATGREDRARGVLVALLWLSTVDLTRAVKLLKRWLEPKPRGASSSELRRAMAAAGARALLSIHSALVPLPRAVVAEQLFLGLAAPLAEWHRDGAEAVLTAVERWLEDPAVVAFLAGDIQEGRGRLLRWAEAHVPERTEVLKAALARLQKATVGEDLGFAGSAVAAVLDRLSYTMEVGPVLELPALAPGERYGLIVIDPKANDDPLARLGLDLAQELAKASDSGLKAALVRLGEGAPAWVPSADSSARITVALGNTKLPPVLGAVLSQELTPDRLAFVLALTETPILDEEDWIGTTWYPRLYTYLPAGMPGHERPWLRVPPFAEGREARDIAAYLAERTGFRWAEQTPPEPPAALPSGPDLTTN